MEEREMDHSLEEERSNHSGEPFLCNNVEATYEDTFGDCNKARVALIDAHSLTRISVTHLLEESTYAKRRSEDFIILPFTNADELLSCCSDCRVELVLLSIGSGCSSDNGVYEDISRLKQSLIDVPLVILSEREEPCCILKALRLGAHSYISTSLDPEVVIQALRLIQVGGKFFPPSILLEPFEEMRVGKDHAAVVGPILLQGFTPRQLEVLQLLRKGKSNKVIAYELNMQEGTVKVHVRQIMKKLKAINRTHAAFLASQMDDDAIMRNSEH